MYTNTSLTQNETTRTAPSKVTMRFHHQDNKIFGLGMEKYDPFMCTKAPQNVVAYGLFGMPVDNFKVFCGPSLGFNVAAKAFQYQKFLMGLKHKNHTAFLEMVSNRVVKKVEGAEDTVSRDNSVALRFDSTLECGSKVGGDVTYKIGGAMPEGKLYGMYPIDKTTSLRAKVATDKSMSFSLLHNFRGINLGFISKVSY